MDLQLTLLATKHLYGLNYATQSCSGNLHHPRSNALGGHITYWILILANNDSNK